MLLHLDSISYTYPGAPDPALSCVTAVFPSGWTGVAGGNGSGKTTLARIACGLLKPDAGNVSPRLAGAYCRQETDLEPDNLFDFACSYDRGALRLRSTLDIGQDWPWRFAELSGGQRRRLQIACALWSEPDLLVLDEPTNDIDAHTRIMLTRALALFGRAGGVGILISHDRALLDALCSQCLFMAKGHATMRPGSYTQGAAQAERERGEAITRRENARREVERIGREAQRRREEASRSDGKRSKRRLDPKDHDARSKIDLALVTGKDGAAGHASARMQTRLQRASDALAQINVEKRYDAAIWTDACVSQRKTLAALPAQTIERGPLRLQIPDLAVGPTDHIVLTGRNGSGKSTLLQKLADTLPNDIVRLAIPQEPTEAQQLAALQRLERLDRHSRAKVLSMVARLNSQPERLLEGSCISPGEMRKLMLALGSLDSPALLMLDEPTNHLDMDSITALQDMLDGFPGAVVLVTHDEYMVHALARTSWRIEHASEAAAPEDAESFRLKID